MNLENLKSKNNLYITIHTKIVKMLFLTIIKSKQILIPNYSNNIFLKVHYKILKRKGEMLSLILKIFKKIEYNKIFLNLKI